MSSVPTVRSTVRTGTRTPTAALVLLATMQVVLIAAITVITVGLPAVWREFHLSSSEPALITSAYGLSFGGLLLLSGRLADLFGRRRVFGAGLAIFGVSSAAAALAPGFAFLVAARFFQGCGAALVAPAALALLSAVYPDPEQRAKVLALWGGFNALGATVGLVLSGVVVTWISWRWTFALPAVVAAAALVLTPVLLPAPPPTPVRLDVWGALLVTAGLSALSYGLLQVGEHGTGSGFGVWGAAAAGVGLLGAFVLVELRHRHPLLPLAFLAPRDRATAIAVIHLTAAGMSAVLFLLTLYLRQVQDYTPIATSLAFLPYCVAQTLTSAVVGRVVARAGSRTVTVAGLLLVAGGLVLLSRIGVESTYVTTLLPALSVFAVGAALSFSGAMVCALDRVPPHHAGLAGGVLNTAMETGPTVGFAVLVSLAAARAAVLTGADIDPDVATTHGYGFAFGVAGLTFLVLAGFTARSKVHRPHQEGKSR